MNLIEINENGIFIDGILQKEAIHVELDISNCCPTCQITYIRKPEGLPLPERCFRDYKLTDVNIKVEGYQVAA